jgi:CelD/BcsL family acetyltransferase involved in cellulose biosynthesis
MSAEISQLTTQLPLRIGARTVGRVKRRLMRVVLTLEEARTGDPCRLPGLTPDADGYLITSFPAERLPALLAAQPRLVPFVRQRYRRRYAALDLGFENYLDTFSSRSRSTLKRKVRKLADQAGGTLDVRCYRSAEELDEFYRHARAVSAKTYQEKLLSAGLPEGDEFLAQMRDLARRDAVRAWILFLEGQPISYLYAPAEGSTLIYAYLGYDPEHAALSPGSVLQYEAMRQLMAEGRFGLFDFTEGEGQHKRLFGTGAVDCVDLLLVRRTLRNLIAGNLLNGFDAAIARAKRAVAAVGLGRLARTFTR